MTAMTDGLGLLMEVTTGYKNQTNVANPTTDTHFSDVFNINQF